MLHLKTETTPDDPITRDKERSCGGQSQSLSEKITPSGINGFNLRRSFREKPTAEIVTRKDHGASPRPEGPNRKGREEDSHGQRVALMEIPI